MKRKFILILSFISVLLSGCYKEIDIELEDGDRRLIVEAWFTTEQKVHEVKLTQSSSYFANEPAPLVSGANVTITGGGDTFVFSEVSPGLYQSAPTAQAKYRTNYTMTIDYNGEIYEASDYCDTVPEIDFMALDTAYDNQGNFTGYNILIWTKELDGYGHYYAWRVLVNGTYVTDTLSQLEYNSDEYLGDGLYFPEWPIDFVSEVASGDIVRLEQHNLSKQTYDAFIAIMSETDWRGGIFDSPPANVPSNFNNDALGLFVASPMFSYEIVVP